MKNTKRSTQIIIISTVIIVFTLILVVLATKVKGRTNDVARNAKKSITVSDQSVTHNSYEAIGIAAIEDDSVTETDSVVEPTSAETVTNVESDTANKTVATTTNNSVAETTKRAVTETTTRKVAETTTSAPKATAPAPAVETTTAVPAAPETTKRQIPWGTSEDFDAYAVEKEMNQYAASLSRCKLDPSLGKNNSCWMGCECSSSYKSEEALKSGIKWIINTCRNDSLVGQSEDVKVYYNIKVFTNEKYGATYYDYYIFYMLGG